MVVDIKVDYIAEIVLKTAEQFFIRDIYRYYRSVVSLHMVGRSCKITILFGYYIGTDNASHLPYFLKSVIQRKSRTQGVAVRRRVGKNNIIIVLF